MLEKVLWGVALFLVIEGLLPFLSPSSWRGMVQRVAEFSDGQVRFIGLSSMLAGLLLLLAFV